ncbi:YbjQ family protein [Diplocloster hominis]|uniref:YbjQ family protein n=1 Tax=Diplocloster hominis TaxID=3079010 RepID=UPI0031BABA87
MDSLMMTSGFNFEGYAIKKYLGFCTGESAIGTGFLSTLGAGIADILGSDSTLYSGKLNKAKNYSLDALIENVRRLGANAVIGVDVNYTMFSSDIIGVVSTGTAVYIEKMEETEDEINTRTLTIHNYYPSVTLRPYEISLKLSKHRTLAALKFYNYSKAPLTALDVTLQLRTVFHSTHTLDQIYFVHFENLSDNRYISEYIPCNLPGNLLPVLKDVIVQLNAFVENDQVIKPSAESKQPEEEISEIRKLFGADAVCGFSETDSDWICVCGMTNSTSDQTCSLCGRKKELYLKKDMNFYPEFINKINELGSSKEILNYALEFQEMNGCLIADEMMEIIERSANMEKIYGNMKAGCLKKVNLLYSEKFAI